MAILVDTTSYLHRLVHVNLDRLKENPEFITHLILNMILASNKKFGASRSNKVVLALDNSSWRKQFYLDGIKNIPDYKGMSYKGNRKKDDSIPWKEIFDIYSDVIHTIAENSDFIVLDIKGAEADDCIAAATKYYKAKGEIVYVISPDKDFNQLYDAPKVNIYDPMKQIFKEHINVDQFKKLHIMIGDKADNILAIKSRLGEKTALKLLPELDLLLQTNPTMRQKWEFNKTLIDFDCIPNFIYDEVNSHLDNDHYQYNATNILKIFSKYKLNKMIENVGDFKLADREIKTQLNQTHLTRHNEQKVVENSLADFLDDL